MASTLTKLCFLLVLVAMAEASSNYWTTIAATEYEHQSSRCREEVSIEPLKKCSSMADCCNELRNIDEECRCKVLMQIAKEVSEEEGIDEKFARQIMGSALGICEIKPYYCKSRVDVY